MQKFCQRNWITEYLTALFFSNAVLVMACWPGRISGPKIPFHQNNNLKYYGFKCTELTAILDLPVLSFFLTQNSCYCPSINNWVWTLAIQVQLYLSGLSQALPLKLKFNVSFYQTKGIFSHFGNTVWWNINLKLKMLYSFPKI